MDDTDLQFATRVELVVGTDVVILVRKAITMNRTCWGTAHSGFEPEADQCGIFVNEVLIHQVA
ncbi:MAG: hypothetical protein ACREX4_12110 [Gammaproteobacteria bacterium]